MAQRRLADASDAVGQSYARLSSGMRINSAADDAAGLAIADSLRADGRIFAQGIRNLNDGISALNIAQGSLQQLSSIVTRQLELAEQAANGIYGTSQRRALHNEVDALVNEFNRIVYSTSFNGQNVLDGSLSSLRLQAGYGLNGGIETSIGNLFKRSVGTGYFNATTYTATAAGPTGPASGDFDRDGDIDIAHAQSDGRLAIQLNNGDGTFAGPVTYNVTGGVYYDLIVDDFNGDGILDIAGSSTTQISVMYGNGNGTFGAASVFSTGGSGDQTRTMRSGDFNGDGIRDIAVGNYNTTSIAILLGNGGSGGFQAARTFAVVSNPLDMAVGDFNGDGLDDIAVTTFTTGGIFLSNGNGTFGSYRQVHSLASRSISIGDFNRDGIDDLVFGSTSGSGNSTASIYLGNGNGTFQTRRSFAIGSDDTFRISVGDMNGDGFDDIAVSVRGSVNQLQVLLGNGGGNFGSALGTNVGTNPTGVALFDANGDGVLDAWVTNAGTNTSSMLMARKTTSASEQAFNLLTREGALSALEDLRDNLDRINLEIGGIGANQSRIAVAINTLAVTRENSISAESRIRDVDVAAESANLILKQITQQAAAAILSQANIQPQIALRLLRN